MIRGNRGQGNIILLSIQVKKVQGMGEDVGNNVMMTSLELYRRGDGRVAGYFAEEKIRKI